MCPDFEEVSHLIPTVNTTVYVPGTIVRFHCDPGYGIIGLASAIICQANGIVYIYFILLIYLFYRTMELISSKLYIQYVDYHSTKNVHSKYFE